MAGVVWEVIPPLGTCVAPTAPEPDPPAVPRETPPPPDPVELARQRIRRILGVADQPEIPRPEHTRLVAVANQKGGVGKTTTAVNLAGALALLGQRVLLIDMDPQGNASTALDLPHEPGTPSVYETLVGGRPLAEAVRPVAVLPNLFGAPATVDLAGAEIELVSQVAREGRLRRSLHAYLAEHEATHGRLDYVVIDCPPSLGLLTLNALVAVSEVLIPLQSEYYALEGLGHLLTTVQLVQEHLNSDLAITGILLTMYDARTKLAPQVADEVRTHFPEPLLRTSIPRSVRVSEAPSYGQTVLEYDPASPGARAYLAAAREFAHDPTFADTDTTTVGDATADAELVPGGAASQAVPRSARETRGVNGGAAADAATAAAEATADAEATSQAGAETDADVTSDAEPAGSGSEGLVEPPLESEASAEPQGEASAADSHLEGEPQREAADREAEQEGDWVVDLREGAAEVHPAGQETSDGEGVVHNQSTGHA